MCFRISTSTINYQARISGTEHIAATRTAIATRLKLAVRFLDSISLNPEDEFFSDGLTEELISTISKIRQLRVISRTSVMPYKKDRSKRS
jgi:TolB-like protein